MPHIIVEHSTNISEDLNPKDLMRTLHDEVAAHDIEAHKIKSRLRPLQDYIIGEDHAQDSMVHVTLLVLEGRGKDFAQTLGKDVYDALERHISDLNITSCFPSLELREMDPRTYYKGKT